MQSKLNKGFKAFLVLTVVSSVFSLQALAGQTVVVQQYVPNSGKSFHKHSGYYRYLPRKAKKIRHHDTVYYYDQGHFYHHTPSGYVIVTAPLGTYIETLPRQTKTIVHQSENYYVYDDTYYVKKQKGYQVVTPPQAVVTSNAVAVEAPEKTVVINVPNPNGSYIPVTLQKYSDGYVGPNGEFYKDYPSIDQLKAMYAKESAFIIRNDEPEEIEFNVLNANGSFTKVTLLKSEDGYVGPEGEFYPKKPTMKQLEQMYSKS